MVNKGDLRLAYVEPSPKIYSRCFVLFPRSRIQKCLAADACPYARLHPKRHTPRLSYGIYVGLAAEESERGRRLQHRMTFDDGHM